MPSTLPCWNLSDLYTDSHDSAMSRDIEECRKRASALSAAWKGRLHESDGKAFASVISEYQEIGETLGRLSSYAELAFAADMLDADNAKLAQSMREVESEINAVLVFVELEIALMDEQLLAGLCKHSAVAVWQPWLRLVVSSRPFRLSREIETLLIELEPSGRSAWIRLFDETAADLRFPIDGTHVSEAEIIDMMLDPDPECRKKAGLSRSKILAENNRLMALIINTIAKEKSVDDRWRGFKHPTSSRNLANDVEDDVVVALAQTVTDAMPSLTHRYYALKAQWMGEEKLNWWDRNAPLPGEDARVFEWDEAKAIILDAFGDFDPSIRDIASQFFEHDWIDAPHRQGKASGAFSHPTVTSAHPYILMNYSGKVNDVMTLAHELGHGIHQVLSAPRGYLMSQTPLTLAETASVFGEMLVFRKLLATTTDADARRALLGGKIEDMLNTVVRQIGFHNFEQRIHEARTDGELTADEIGDIWMQTQAQALGPAVLIDDSYRPLWGFIPHFIHAPFYVYAYAFGDCLVNALWQVYSGAGSDKSKQGAFTSAYIDLLKAGGMRKHDEALAPFGLSAHDASFWSLGLDAISAMIDELEAELRPHGITSKKGT